MLVPRYVFRQTKKFILRSLAEARGYSWKMLAAVAGDCGYSWKIVTAVPTTMIFYPGVAEDDGKWNNYGWFNSGLTDIDFGFLGGEIPQSHNLFVRFPTVTVPHGATIISAFVGFTAFENRSGESCKASVYFNDIDDAIAPTDADAADALILTAAIPWNGVEPWVASNPYSSPELATILQSVVNRSGWASGKSLQVVIKNNSSDSDAWRRANAVENGSGIPELHITWTS